MSYAGLQTRPLRHGYARGLSGIRRARGMSGLGDNSSITPQDAWIQASSSESSPDFSNPSWVQSEAMPMITQGQMILNPSGCPSGTAGAQGAMGGSPLGLVKQAGGLALTTTSAISNYLVQSSDGDNQTAVDVAGAIPIVGAVFSTIVGIFSIFAQHHAAAVAQEQQLECTAVPAANNYLAVIQQAVANGTSTPQEAIDALNSLVSDFDSYVSPAVQHNPCNANCTWSTILAAIVIYQTAQYQALAAQQAAAAAAAPPPAPTPVLTQPNPGTPPPGGVVQAPTNVSTGNGATTPTTPVANVAASAPVVSSGQIIAGISNETLLIGGLAALLVLGSL